MDANNNTITKREKVLIAILSAILFIATSFMLLRGVYAQEDIAAAQASLNRQANELRVENEKYLLNIQANNAQITLYGTQWKLLEIERKQGQSAFK